MKKIREDALQHFMRNGKVIYKRKPWIEQNRNQIQPVLNPDISDNIVREDQLKVPGSLETEIQSSSSTFRQMGETSGVQFTNNGYSQNSSQRIDDFVKNQNRSSIIQGNFEDNLLSLGNDSEPDHENENPIEPGINPNEEEHETKVPEADDPEAVDPEADDPESENDDDFSNLVNMCFIILRNCLFPEFI